MQEHLHVIINEIQIYTKFLSQRQFHANFKQFLPYLYDREKKTVLYFTDFKSDVFLLADHKLFLDYSTKKFELFLHYIDMESIALKAKIKLKQRKRLEIPSADTSSGAPDSVRGILH